MSLYLAESVLPKDQRDRHIIEKLVADISDQAVSKESSLVEVQIANDLLRAFFIFESSSQSVARELLTQNGLSVTLVKPVRIVGQELEQIQNKAGQIRYLVEWNLPEGLTMEAYLSRKKQNSVHYAKVPEVSFQRTYVCEDLTKCLCFYDAPDEESVHKARQAVGAPVDAITETIDIKSKTNSK